VDGFGDFEVLMEMEERVFNFGFLFGVGYPCKRSLINMRFARGG
jgi:hypothetical protein